MSTTTPAKKTATPRRPKASARAGTGPTIPATAKQPTDRPAPQREAEGDQEVTVEWRGDTFSVPADGDDWPAEASIAFETGAAINGVRLLLGPRQWALVAKHKPTTRDVGELFQLIGEAMGMESTGE